MRKIMVAGNWKMNGGRESIADLLEGVVEGLRQECPADVVVFPPFPYLAQVRDTLRDTPVQWGAQNVNPEPSGAHTGEVAASMLLDFDCRYVLVGHSERRSLYGESDADVADRFAAASAAGLVPVLCVGETLEERQSDHTEAVVERQLEAVLERTGIAPFRSAVVAYEPVWAIGTGQTASPEQAQAVHALIRHKFTALDGTIGGQLRILYGGSVNGSNAADLFAREDIDGGLVGGASLTAEGFLAICRAVLPGD